MIEDLVRLLLYVPYTIIDFCFRRGNITTELDVLNALHPTEWRIVQEVAYVIRRKKKEGGWTDGFTQADCWIILRRLVNRGWAKTRKRENGPSPEYVVTGDGIKHRFENRQSTSEAVTESVTEHGS